MRLLRVPDWKLGLIAVVMAGMLTATGQPRPLEAADGTLDPLFGNAGKLTIPLSNGNDYAYALALQADGKIVIGGYTKGGSNSDFSLVRLQTNGALDATFGSGGKAIAGVGSGDDAATCIGIQADGKIVLGGQIYNGVDLDFGLARFRADGMLDSTFGNGGKVISALGPGDDEAQALVIQPDGKILLAGASFSGGQRRFAVVRYQPDGQLDTGFGNSGIVTTSIGLVSDAAFAMALQRDGKIVLAGRSTVGSVRAFAAARYQPDGQLDVGFGNGGKVVTPIGTGDADAYGIAIQADGKIVIAGGSTNGTKTDFALVRYLSDGSLDSGFGTNGIATTSFTNGSARVLAVTIQADGPIVAAGAVESGNNIDVALARYLPTGSLDTTFGNGGTVVTAMGGQKNLAQAIALQADGKIVIAGNQLNTNYDVMVARYTGTPVATLYVDQAWTTTPIGGDPDGAGPALRYGYDAFSTVAQAAGNAGSGVLVRVAAGNYTESVTLARNLTIEGIAGSTVLQAPPSSTFILRLTGGTATLRNLGFQTTGTAISVTGGSGHTVTGSNFPVGSTALQNTTGQAVQATSNYWGHASGPRHAANTGGTGATVSDNVTYSPWCTAPAPACTPLAGIAAQLVFTTQPGGAASNVPLSPQPVVEVRDAAGNVARQFNGTVSLVLTNNANGAVLSGQANVNATDGVATFSGLTVDKAGTGYTLTAYALGLPSVTSAPFNIVAGPATRLLFQTQPGNGVMGQPLLRQPVVQAGDAAGNLVSSFAGTVTLTIANNPGGGTLIGTVAVSSNNGVFPFSDLAIDRPGNGYTLQASAPGLASVVSALFNISYSPQLYLPLSKR